MLDDMLTTAAPFVAAAVHEAADPALTAFARIYPSPLRLEVVFVDAHGIVRRTWRAPCDAFTAELTAMFLNDGLVQLPETIRRKTLAMVEANVAEMMVSVDVEAGTVTAILAPHDDAGTPLALFTLRRPETLH